MNTKFNAVLAVLFVCLFTFLSVGNAAAVTTIYVAPGAYTENLTLNKSVDIIGSGAGSTTITGSHVATVSDVSLDGVTLEIGASIGLTIDSSAQAISNISVTNCILNIGDPGIGIWLGGGTPTNPVSNITMDGNTFNGPVSMIANPWKIGGQFGSPLNCQVTNVDFINNQVNKCSTPINLGNGNINDVLINNNIYSNTDGCVYVWDDRVGTVTGVLSNFVFTNNDVDGTNSYGVAFGGAALSSLDYSTANVGTGNVVNNNNFIGITITYGFGAVSNSINGYTVDARNNYWGGYRGANASDGFRNGSVTSVENSGLIDAGSITPSGPVNITLGEYGADSEAIPDGTYDDVDADDDGDGFSDTQELAAGTDQLLSTSVPPSTNGRLYVDANWALTAFGTVVSNAQTAANFDIARTGFNAFANNQAAINAAQ